MRLLLVLTVGLLALWQPGSLWAQGDSLARAVDTVGIDTPPPSARPIQATPPATRIPDQATFGPGDSLKPRMPNWVKEEAEASRGPVARTRRALNQYQDTYGPRIYERADGKTRLYLRFPKRDSVVIPFPKGFLPQPTPPPYDPTVAWQRSALIPGWGQAYTRGYWKMPLWWAGYAAIGWWLNYNHQFYQIYGDAFFCLAVRGAEGCTIPTDLQGIDTEGLREQRNAFRQRRDNAVLWLVGWHSFQVIEAFVAAHLKEFDVSDDLSFRLVPAKPVSGLGTSQLGMGVALQF